MYTGFIAQKAWTLFSGLAVVACLGVLGCGTSDFNIQATTVTPTPSESTPPTQTAVPASYLKQLGLSTSGTSAAGNDQAVAFVLDGFGNQFVTGYTNGALGEANGGGQDVFVAKFDSTGTKQWVKQLGSVTMGAAASGNDQPTALTLDALGNIFVTGYTSGALGEANGGSTDVFVAKFDSTGTKQWVKQLGSVTMGAAASASDIANGIVLDSSGNIFLGGMTFGALGEANAGFYDVFVAKFDSAGTKQWVKQLGSVTMGAAASGFDYAYALALDSLGNIFVTGNTAGALGEANGGGTDIFVAKFDSAGVKQWVKQLGSVTMGAAAAGGDNVTAIALDSAGNIFVTGYTQGALGEANGGGNDIYIAKFNSAGIKQWVKQLGSVTMGAAASGSDLSYGIVLDTSGNIFIAGLTNGALGEAVGGGTDLIIAKFDSAGTKQWIKQLGSVTKGAAASGNDQANGIALDTSGNIFVTGLTNGSLGETNGGSYDVIIAKFKPDGTF